MKRSVLYSVVLVLVSAFLILASGCTLYDSSNTVVENGVEYFVSRLGTRSFASYCYWDGDPGNTEITIPDELSNGSEVEGLGGYFGTGVWMPFRVVASKEIQPDGIELFDSPAEGTEVIRIVFHVNIGKNADNVLMTSGGDYFAVKGEDGRTAWYSPSYDFAIDPENPYLEMVDGKIFSISRGYFLDLPYADSITSSAE